MSPSTPFKTTAVTVCIPWRPQPDRIAAYDRCRKYWQDRRFTVVSADSDPTRPFVCNEARNNAVAQADTDIVIIADGDTLPENLHQVATAIAMVDRGEADIVWPFTVYRYLPPTWVDAAVSDMHAAPILGETMRSPGGIIVARRKSFWSIGGFDPYFVPGASGFDDTSFQIAAETLLTTARVIGTVYSIDHPDSVHRQYDDTNPNHARYRLYLALQGDPTLMAELVKGHPQP